MFTSKKAQYLNKDFDRISPITNIDTLYYEQAEKSKDTNGSYIIKRRSVGKHLPIRFDISTLDERTYVDISVSNSTVPIEDTCLGSEYLDVCVNINYNKEFIVNPSNPEDNKLIYKFQQYKIYTNDYVNIQELLKYYEPRDQFSSSIGAINSSLDNINSSITNVSNFVDNTSLAVDVLINALTSHAAYYNNASIDGSNNGIYNLIYQPTSDASCLIKVQCISTNTIKNIVSLDTAFNHSQNVSVDQWIFHYDVSSNKIIYLQDEHGNEGNFDFRMAHQIYNNDLINSSFFINNKLYFEPTNNNILFEGNGKFEGNQIYNSFNITFTGNASNNIVVNSSNVSISGSGNRIYNSTNTSTLIIKKSNNTIINCVNSSILVNGDLNYIVNVENQNISLGDNNTIVGDIAGCPINASTFNNSKLFLSNSVSTALSLDLTNYKTVFGDASVYFGGIITTNKY